MKRFRGSRSRYKRRGSRRRSRTQRRGFYTVARGGVRL